ncbi:MAG: hypothetical protein ABJG78_13345 [Cyclobacteriaceae bacterium]
MTDTNKTTFSALKSEYMWFAVIIILLLALSGCYYDNTEDLYPTLSNINCTSGQVSFSSQVLPLMNQSCNTAGCHNSIDRAAQIVLDNYTDLLVSANDGSLVSSMRFEPGFSPMPQGAAKLDDCSIQLVADWIVQGTLNN